jgi:hypothetical protein
MVETTGTTGKTGAVPLRSLPLGIVLATTLIAAGCGKPAPTPQQPVIDRGQVDQSSAPKTEPAYPITSLADLQKYASEPHNASSKPRDPAREMAFYYHKGLRDEHLAYLKESPDLQVLFLTGAPITDKGLVHLKVLSKLWALELDGTQITDNGLESLKDLSNLRQLSVRDTGITGTGLKHLNALKKLKYLNLERTKITDEDLQAFKNMEQLEFVGLIGTPVTDAGIAELKKARPKLKIAR